MSYDEHLISQAGGDGDSRKCGCLPDERCYWCAPCVQTDGCIRLDKHKSKCAVRG